MFPFFCGRRWAFYINLPLGAGNVSTTLDFFHFFHPFSNALFLIFSFCSRCCTGSPKSTCTRNHLEGTIQPSRLSWPYTFACLGYYSLASLVMGRQQVQLELSRHHCSILPVRRSPRHLFVCPVESVKRASYANERVHSS